MRTLSLLCLVFMATAFWKPQYEFGMDQSVHWASEPYHPLQASVAVPRNFVSVIKFSKEFPLTPVVVIANNKIDAKNGTVAGTGQGFDITIDAITKVGFTIKYAAITPNAVFGFDLAWAAILDPNIYVYEAYHPVLNLQAAKPGGTKQQGLEYNFPESWTLASVPNIAMFITGVQFVQADKWAHIDIKLAQAFKNKFQVVASAKYDTKVAYLRFNCIIGLPDTLHVGKFSYLVPTATFATDNFYTNDPPSERTKPFTAPITDPQFQKGIRLPMFGISAFSYGTSNNLRVLSKNFKMGKTEMSAEIGTWYDTQMYEVTANWFIYQPKADTKITDPDCAIVFEECDYKGDSFIVCDRKLSFPKDGWNKPVRSFKVPEDKVLKVYNMENLEGKTIRIEKDTPCMNNPPPFIQSITLLQAQDTTFLGQFWDE